jgi:hypothetical protein
MSSIADDRIPEGVEVSAQQARSTSHRTLKRQPEDERGGVKRRIFAGIDRVQTLRNAPIPWGGSILPKLSGLAIATNPAVSFRERSRRDLLAALSRTWGSCKKSSATKLVVLVGQIAIAVRNVSGRKRWSKLSEWLRPEPPASRQFGMAS